MDAFKLGEVARMDKGGNKAWRLFFDEHQATKVGGWKWDECTISERYDGEVGEEWKERLTATIEGKDYVPIEKTKREKSSTDENGRLSGDIGPEVGSRSGKPLGRETTTTELAIGLASSSPSRKIQNDAYFAKLGAQNATRSGDIPPHQGGKYTGFGSEPAPNTGASMPGIDDFHKDPVAALTKSFGWFSSVVGKSAKSVNDSYIQPTAQKVYSIIITSAPVLSLRRHLSFTFVTSLLYLSHPHLMLSLIKFLRFVAPSNPIS